MSGRRDLSGMRFGRLTAISFSFTRCNQSYWLCKCDCGREKTVCYSALTSGTTRSCGCLNSEVASRAMTKMNLKHGCSREKLYIKWQGMVSRCCKESDSHYKSYGGRGITVCDEWKDNYEAFRTWALANGYEESLTLDRIDVNGNYCPGNCRFVPMSAQAKNKQNTHYVTIGGITKCIAEWSKETGISGCTLLYRLRKGWAEDKLLSPTSSKHQHRRKTNA